MPGVVSSLDVIRRASMTLWTRVVTSVAAAVRGRRFAVSIAAIVIVAGVLAIPRQHRVSCDCLVQPSVRRYVPLPFDAVLSESLVTPGDIVEIGQRLATLDGREVRCDLAAIEADAERIGKQRDMALAQGKTTEVQIARLELARLEQQRLVLERHASQLEIRSPIRGVVISGDLDKVQGASLDKGHTLFEVGPLDKMTVEVMIEESEIALTQVGAAVTLRLDSVPGRVWQGSIEKIHPRAEIHEDDNVFVADVRLGNALGELRPGMKGKASIAGPRRSIGWTLFHKPWRSLQRWFRV
jgi:multidrug resistance efflux pump